MYFHSILYVFPSITNYAECRDCYKLGLKHIIKVSYRQRNSSFRLLHCRKRWCFTVWQPGPKFVCLVALLSVCPAWQRHCLTSRLLQGFSSLTYGHCSTARKTEKVPIYGDLFIRTACWTIHTAIKPFVPWCINAVALITRDKLYSEEWTFIFKNWS